MCKKLEKLKTKSQKNYPPLVNMLFHKTKSPKRNQTLTLLIACKNAAFPTFSWCFESSTSIFRFSCSIRRRFSSSFILIVDSLVASTRGLVSSSLNISENYKIISEFEEICVTHTITATLVRQNRLLLPSGGVRG